MLPLLVLYSLLHSVQFQSHFLAHDHQRCWLWVVVFDCWKMRGWGNHPELKVLSRQGWIIWWVMSESWLIHHWELPGEGRLLDVCFKQHWNASRGKLQIWVGRGHAWVVTNESAFTGMSCGIRMGAVAGAAIPKLESGLRVRGFSEQVDELLTLVYLQRRCWRGQA